MGAVRATLWGFGIRLMLVCISRLADRHLSSIGSHLRYTDVDYHVFSDAALLVLNNKSPYDRFSYRYPPIFAWLLVPNHLLFPEFGKLLFCLSDAFVAYLLHAAILARSQVVRGAKLKDLERADWYAWAWALNPFSAVICSRGSADSLALVVIQGALLATLQGSVVISGLLMGLAAHLRLFPIFYIPTLMLFDFAKGFCGNGGRSRRNQRKVSRNVTESVQHALYLGVSAAAAIAFCTLLGLAAYGSAYWDNAIWYHLGRKDHRHNFAPHFYPTYLQHSQTLQSSSGKSNVLENHKDASAINSNLDITQVTIFAPQAVLLLACIFALARREPELCLLAQTLIFVAFNKVCTAQYLTWYLSLVPLVVARVCGAQGLRKVDLHLWSHRTRLLTGAWAASLTAWLWQAHGLEMRGLNAFGSVWVCSLSVHMVQIAGALAVIRIGLVLVATNKEFSKFY